MFFIKKQIGVTLIELTVVLLVLVALAGVAIPYVNGTSSTALCNATDVTMQNIKKVIMERYYLDTLGHFPVSRVNGVVGSDYNLNYLFLQSGWQSFDPQTQVGWRGAYLQSGLKLGTAPYLVANLDTSFQDATAVPNNHVNANLINMDTVILDGWGRPIILQVSNCSNWGIVVAGTTLCARLVSAGAGTGIGLSNAAINATIDTTVNGNRPAVTDDRILYLNAPTPANDTNPPCNTD